MEFGGHQNDALDTSAENVTGCISPSGGCDFDWCDREAEMSMYEALKGPAPWRMRFLFWWRHKVLRRPIPTGEMEQWDGITFIETEDR